MAPDVEVEVVLVEEELVFTEEVEEVLTVEVEEVFTEEVDVLVCCWPRLAISAAVLIHVVTEIASAVAVMVTVGAVTVASVDVAAVTLAAVTVSVPVVV